MSIGTLYRLRSGTQTLLLSQSWSHGSYRPGTVCTMMHTVAEGGAGGGVGRMGHTVPLRPVRVGIGHPGPAALVVLPPVDRTPLSCLPFFAAAAGAHL